MIGRRQRRYGAVSDINIANLVDVVLVLLIIFMISAPLLQSGIEVELPHARSAALDEEATGVVVTLDAKGGIYVNDRWANPNRFEQVLDSALKAEQTGSVYLRGDSSISYGSAISIIGRIKDMGIESIGLVTAQTDKKSK
jgi:biopolymer transport protein TolR